MESSNGVLNDRAEHSIFLDAPIPRNGQRPSWLRSCYLDQASITASLEADGDELKVTELPWRRLSKRKAKRRLKRPPQAVAALAEEEELSLPPIGSLARTTRLLLAALRVWELRNGFR